MAGHAVEVRVELGPGVHRPGRIVRVTDEDELRAIGDRLQHRVQVVAPVDERDRPGDAAELRRPDHIAGEARPAADDLVARLDRDLRERVDDAVGACAERDLLEANAVPLGECRR